MISPLILEISVGQIKAKMYKLPKIIIHGKKKQQKTVSFTLICVTSVMLDSLSWFNYILIRSYNKYIYRYWGTTNLRNTKLNCLELPVQHIYD